jgi:Tfp pilus assembly protein PilO
MGRPAVNRLQWTVKRWLLGLRWPGWAGLGLLALAAAVYVGAVQPARQRLRALDQEAAELARKTGGRAAVAEPVTSRSQLSNFYAFFPLMRSVPDVMAQIEHTAGAHELMLEKGEYRLSRESEFRLSRYQMTLPVRGSYTDIRGFVNDVLDAVPAVALEDLTLKREAADDPELEAKVRFLLYLGVE